MCCPIQMLKNMKKMKLNEASRYKLIITDENGRVLFQNHHTSSFKDGIFSKRCLSFSDISSLKKYWSSGNYRKAVAVREADGGKLWLLTGALFPSTRVFSGIITDIDFETAAPLIKESFKSIEIFGEINGKITRRHEKIYEELAGAVCVANELFSCDTFVSDFQRFVTERIKDIAHFACSNAEINEIKMCSEAPENFDVGLFTLFLLLSLGASSVFSAKRKAVCRVSCELSSVSVEIAFDLAGFDRIHFSDLSTDRKAFEAAFSYLRSICEQNNIPFGIEIGQECRIRINPLRAEVSLMGLKHPMLNIKE